MSFSAVDHGMMARALQLAELGLSRLARCEAHTLASLAGPFARLAYLASLRDFARDEYAHWGMENIYGAEAANTALAQLHREVFREVSALPLGELAGQIQERLHVDVRACYQCGRCTAGCPVAYAMDAGPHQIMRGLQLEQRVHHPLRFRGPRGRCGVHQQRL